MTDPRSFADNLEPGTDGLWWPRTRSHVDYPDEGNAFCFQVEDGSFWFRHRNACLLTVMARFPPAGTVFDIGGGNGFAPEGSTPTNSARAPSINNQRSPVLWLEACTVEPKGRDIEQCRDQFDAQTRSFRSRAGAYCTVFS